MRLSSSRFVRVLPAFLLLAACSVFGGYKNPDAKIARAYVDIQGASDTTTALLRAGTIKADEAQIVHDILTTAKTYLDRSKAIWAAARTDGRDPTESELAQAGGWQQLALDGLKKALARIAEYEARKGGA